MKSGKVLTAVFILVILLGALLYVKDIADGIRNNLDTVNENVEKAQTVTTKIDYSTGQLIYVPIYDQIPFGQRKKQGLNILLSVRNTDAQNSITFSRIDLYDTDGNLVKQYADSDVVISPLGTFEIYIAQEEASGGSGGNFYLQWESDEKILEPYVEALLYAVSGTQSYSFNSVGKIVS